MSSRVLRGEIRGRITPVSWRAASKGEAAPGTRRKVAQGNRRTESLPEDRRKSLEEDWEQGLRRSYEEGFQKGREASRKDHEAEAQPFAETLEEIVASFSDLRMSVRKESEQELIELSIRIAQRILHRELTLDPEAVRALALVALERVGARELNRVRVHPAHQDLLQSLLERACPGGNVKLVTDPRLKLGSLLFESERGDLDASIDSQLEEIRRGLADRLSS